MSGQCLRVSVILFVSLPSPRIITSGRQISTVSIVGRSVYLLTRKDSLCYNRLISLPPRALISSQPKIETIIAVCKGGGGILALSSALPQPQIIRLTLAGAAGSALTLKNEKLSQHITMSSLPPGVLSLKERRASYLSVYLCLTMCASPTPKSLCKRRSRKEGRTKIRQNNTKMVNNCLS